MSRNISMAEAINEAIRNEMRSNPRVVLLGQDIGPYGGTFGVYRGLFEEFGPERVRDGPLCEAATTGIGIGLAISGRPAVVEIEFMDFITLASDAIVNQAAKLHYFFNGQMSVPLVVRTPVVNRLGFGSQHSQSFEAWFMHVPGLQVVVPSNASDARGLMMTALRSNNPTVFVENVRLYSVREEVPEASPAIPFGQVRILRSGKDISFIGYGGMMKPCLDAAEALASQGVEAEVVDVRTLSPLDREGICRSVKKTGRAIVTHEAVKTGGPGAEIAQSIVEGAFDYLKAPIARLAAHDVPIPTGKLQESVFPSAGMLLEEAHKLMKY